MKAVQRQANEIVMPVRIVLQTSILFALMLISTQVLLFAWFFTTNTSVSQAHISATAIITCVVAIPFMTYLAVRSENQRADLHHLKRISQQDFLTGLSNRRSFEETAAAHLKRASAGTGAGAFLFLDADNFKSLNDRMGHAFGDAVLCSIANSITSNIRPGDLAVRIGGDEFGVLLLGATVSEGVVVAERIRRSIKQNSSEIGNSYPNVSVSIGVAVHRPGETIDDLMRQADRQLYSAKNSGRDTILAVA